MKRLVFLGLTLLMTVSTASAAPRFAIVRVKDIYRDLPSTAAMQARVKTAHEDLLRDVRAEKFREIIAELQTLQGRIQDKGGSLDEETSRELARAYELKRQEAQAMQREFENFRTERTKEINRGMVEEMRASLDRISETATKLAHEQGYDAVFDSSGDTNTGLPLLLYVKDARDLTDDVMAALGDEASATGSDSAAFDPSDSPEND